MITVVPWCLNDINLIDYRVPTRTLTALLARLVGLASCLSTQLTVSLLLSCASVACVGSLCVSEKRTACDLVDAGWYGISRHRDARRRLSVIKLARPSRQVISQRG
jgi:hypothetical protein